MKKLSCFISIVVFAMFHFDTAFGAETPMMVSPDPSLVDETVKPCDDFYRYACGKWLETAKIPADKPKWNRSFSTIDEQNEILSRELLEGYAQKARDPKATPNVPENPYAKKLGDYYSSCMDESKLETASMETLKSELADVDSLTKANIAERLAQLQRRGIALFFRFDAAQDYKNPLEMIAELHQGGMALPTKEYYLDEKPEMVKIRNAYVSHIQKMFSLAGIPSEQAEVDAKSVLALETKLAKAALLPAELRDPKKLYHRMNLQGLKELSPPFDWSSFLKSLDLPKSVPLNVTIPGFLRTSAQVIEETELPAIKAYARIRILDAAAGALPDRFLNEYFDFFAKNFLGLAEIPPRWKRCVDATESALGFALSRSYVALRFSGESKPFALKTLKAIEKQTGRVLDEATWMDPKTRKEAHRKLGKLANQIGYPNKWRNYDDLTVGQDSYLANKLASAQFETRYELNKIGKPVDRSEWHLLPSAVNAYYEPQLGQMVFPAGILQPPFFNKDYLSESNYAGIGMVMGHEISHGFDDQGRQFDSKGSLRDWWTPSTDKEFSARAQCLAKQFDTFKTPAGDPINGQLTLGENIGDQAGLKIAFGAWKNQLSKAERKDPVKLREREKSFFLSYAQAWCGKTTDAYLRTMVRSNPHPPGNFRVLGTLMNNPEFANAYQCEAESKMVPKDRCIVW